MNSIDPVIEYLFGNVLGHLKSKTILENLTKSGVEDIHDFFGLRDFKLFKLSDQNLLTIFQKFLYQEIKSANLNSGSIPIDGQFWFNITTDSLSFHILSIHNSAFILPTYSYTILLRRETPSCVKFSFPNRSPPKTSTPP